MSIRAMPRAVQTIFLTSGKWSPTDPGWWYQVGMKPPVSWNRPISDHFVDVNKIVLSNPTDPASDHIADVSKMVR